MKKLTKSGEKGGKLKDILSIVFLAAAIAFTAYVMIMNMQGKAVSVFGYSVLRVVTGSMEPTIFTGDYIIVQKTTPAELKEGDIITYYTEVDEIKDLIVTHRIIKVNDDGSFITQGDANQIPDSIPVKPERLLGKYLYKARFFGMIASFADSSKLILFLVIIPILLMSIYETKTLAKQWKEYKQEVGSDKTDNMDKEIERIKQEAIEEYKKKKEQEADGKEGQEEYK
ncbi:MAG: signal peptidase I [Clostridiales bacterium]|nr:signal peptidase I [Clostridiales bacterium]